MDPVLRAQFWLRDHLWGRLKLRPGLPPPIPQEQTRAEEGFYELILSRAYPPLERESVGLLWDVGCRNWSYARALARMFPRARLIGVELDGGRRYWNLYRRIDQARAMAQELKASGGSASCIYGDFLEVPVDADDGATKSLSCFFFPFVSAHPCRSWGLPERYCSWLPLLEHARGDVLSCHQGEWEAELARGIYARAGRQSRETIIPARDFAGLWPSPHDVVVMRG